MHNRIFSLALVIPFLGLLAGVLGSVGCAAPIEEPAATGDSALSQEDSAAESVSLPIGTANLLGAAQIGNPWTGGEPWTPNPSGCRLDLTIRETSPGHYSLRYLVPRSSPTVSGRVSLVENGGVFFGRDVVNPGVVVQRSWDRTVTLTVQDDGQIAWSLVSREENTTTVGGPAGGYGGGRTSLWRCDGVTSASAFRR